MTEKLYLNSMTFVNAYALQMLKKTFIGDSYTIEEKYPSSPMQELYLRNDGNLDISERLYFYSAHYSYFDITLESGRKIYFQIDKYNQFFPFLLIIDDVNNKYMVYGEEIENAFIPTYEIAKKLLDLSTSELDQGEILDWITHELLNPVRLLHDFIIGKLDKLQIVTKRIRRYYYPGSKSYYYENCPVMKRNR